MDIRKATCFSSCSSCVDYVHTTSRREKRKIYTRNPQHSKPFEVGVREDVV